MKQKQKQKGNICNKHSNAIQLFTGATGDQIIGKVLEFIRNYSNQIQSLFYLLPFCFYGSTMNLILCAVGLDFFVFLQLQLSNYLIFIQVIIYTYKSQINNKYQHNMNANLIEQQQIAEIIKKRYNQKENLISLTYLPQQWPHILRARNWSQLQLLFLDKCKINDANVSTLVDCELPQVQSLWLSSNQLTSKGLKQLVKKDWTSLNTLKLNENKIGDDGFRLLIQKELKALKNIELHSCGIGWGGLKVLTQFNVLGIASLELSKNNIGVNGVKFIVKSNLINLENLFLDYCYLGTEGVKNLTKGRWPKLKFLNLSNNEIQFDGYLALAEKKWPSLKKIFIGDFHNRGDFIVDGISMLLLTMTQSKQQIIKKTRNKKMEMNIQKIIERKKQVKLSKMMGEQKMKIRQELTQAVHAEFDSEKAQNIKL